MKWRDLLMADKLRGMSVGELKTTLDQKHLELMNLRFQSASNRLEDTNRLSEVRREIARIQTVLRERQLWEEYERGSAQ